MPNKPFQNLNPLDRQIRRLSPNKGMCDGVEPQIRITLIRGFELFHNRPHHNYETWSDGYKVEAFRDSKLIAEVLSEDLDDALNLLGKALDKYSTLV